MEIITCYKKYKQLLQSLQLTCNCLTYFITETEKALGIGGVLGWILLCWNAVLVLVLALALRALLPDRLYL
jgi:hypothetical protein